MATDADKEIIELIDQGNYNYAQTLLAKKIAKFPQKSLYYALQNKIFSKIGQKDLATKKNVELMNRSPNDPLTIEILSEFFEEVGMERESSLVYENAIKKYPVSAQNLCLHWFDKSIEKFDFKLINRIFMYLNKHIKSREYTLWYAFSFHLFLKEGDKDKEKLYASLGKKLVEGLQSFENTQEIYMYTLFLDSKETEELLLGIDIPLDLELKLIYMKSMEENESFEKLHQYTEKLLFKENFDDFDTWKLWIQSGKEIGKSFEELSGKTTQQTRNLLLLQIELDKLYDRDISGSVQKYYQKFNNKLCCYPDLSQYDLPPAFIDQIKATDVAQLITLVNNRKFLGTTDNWDIYDKYSSPQGAEFDNNPVNELTLRSILATLDESSESIIRSIIIIHELLKQDTYNYRLKLWLMKLYSRLNTGDVVFPIYNGLKIKMVQHETLSHYLTHVSPSKDSLKGFVDIFRFYLTAKDEVQHTIKQGFESGVYNKLESFIHFGKRLQNSVSLNFTIAKVLQTSLVTGDDVYLNYFINYLIDNEPLVVADYTDNRDFKSEWNGLENTGALSIPFVDNTIKLKLLIYLIIFRPGDSAKLLKLYNKITSNEKFTTFDSLLFRLYFNLLKITKTTLNPQEAQSLFNYIQKNLKIDKLKVLVPENLLSSELNQNLANLVEFTKIVKLVAKRRPSATLDPLLAQIKPLSKELKDLKLVQKQEALIDEMNIDLPLSIDAGPIKDEIKQSIANSTSILLNSV
ncbi:N-terminal acetyltransferase B complex subunit MDM20 [Candida viswanathii]|uniref:N-terminal acetyltransferase B complex subunit MDM20 n=1 Tax=Candida viswanathii TaxID=5486 RepID=A0A367XTC0_9ASCO|nr:N-terminal acetyltransferase B complex subunit MDM20 [Candida viswanathii]